MLSFLKTARAQHWLRRAFFLAAAIALVMALLPHPPQVPLVKGDKLQHMLAFFTLGVLATGGWPKRPLVSVFVGLAIFGAMIEVFQAVPALHRTSDIMDWLADMAATLAALLLGRTFFSVITYRSDEQG